MSDLNGTYFIPQSREQIEERYGNIITLDKHLVWPNASHWLKPCMVQPEIQAVLTCSISNKPVEHIFLNIDVHKPLLDVFDMLIARGLHFELKTFDGAYSVRFVRGREGVYSLHSWALAVDLNAADNPLGGESDWTDDFVDCWESAGFTWGGRFKRPDPMHFQWSMTF